METTEIRVVFLKVLTESLESAANLGYVDDNPASAIEEALPNFYTNRKNPGHEEYLALYTLVDYWADSFDHGFTHLFGIQPPISVDEARGLLEIAVKNLQSDEPVTDPRILKWADV